MPETDPLLERIQHVCRVSNGTMRVCIVVADDAEKARGLELIHGRKNARLITFATRAESEAAHAVPGTA